MWQRLLSLFLSYLNDYFILFYFLCAQLLLLKLLGLCWTKVASVAALPYSVGKGIPPSTTKYHDSRGIFFYGFYDNETVRLCSFYIFCCKRLLDFAKFFFYIDAIIISVSPFALVIWLCMLIDFHTKYLHINIYYCYFFSTFGFYWHLMAFFVTDDPFSSQCAFPVSIAPFWLSFSSWSAWNIFWNLLNFNPFLPLDLKWVF